MNAAPKNFTLGLDLSQNSFHASIATPRDRTERWRDLPNAAFDLSPNSPEGIDALIEWMQQIYPGARCKRLVVESTGPLSRRFAAAAAPADALPAPAIVNSNRTKKFGDSLGVRDKTDRFDACVIALFGAVQRPRPTAIRSAVERELRELNRTRESLVNERTSCNNAMLSAEFDSVAAMWLGLREQIEDRIKDIEKQMDELIKSDPMLKKQVAALEQIEGVGKVSARTLSAELGDLRQWSRNQVVSIAGLFPRQYESGKSVWSPPRMVKGGGKRLRRVLYMCAVSIFKTQGPLRAYADRLCMGGKTKMQVIGALMRKILIVARAVMMNDGHYDPTKICSQKKVSL